MLRTLLILILVALSHLSYAQESDIITDSLYQEEDLMLGIKEKHYGDSIVLRWAPSRENGWVLGNISGYEIHRLELDENYESIGTWDTLLTPIIYPWSMDKFKAEILLNPNDDYIIAAAECLYGSYLEKDDTQSMSIFEKADLFRDRFTISLLSADVSIMAATGLGWRYVDKDIDPKANYLYRVFCPSKNHLSVFLDNSVLVKPGLNNPTPIIQDAVQKERQVDLMLLREAHNEHFTAYKVERSQDGGDTWVDLQDGLPYTQPLTDQSGIGNERFIVYRDTGLVNYKKYFYRVSGYTPFGDLSPPSLIVESFGVDRTPCPPPDRFKANMQVDGTMLVEWEYDIVPVDLEGFILGRSDKPFSEREELHKDILPANSRSFKDLDPSTTHNNFYTLYVLDTALNVSYTNSTYGEYIDSIPPSAPIFIDYTIDTSGILVLNWEQGNEPDLMGYHVFAANSTGEYMTNVSNLVIQDLKFVDTLDLRSLTESKYYRITALDMNYNVSEYSELIRVKKPDIVAPSAPIIVDHNAGDDFIELEINKSSSRDVVNYSVEHKKKGDDMWVEVRGTERSKNSKLFFMDSQSLIAGQLYVYKVAAIDEAGNRSKDTYTYTARTRLPKEEGYIIDFTAIREKHKIVLAWNYTGRNDDIIRIYRAEDRGKFDLIRSYDANLLMGKDFTTHKGIEYEYRIVLLTHDGRILASSDTVKLPIWNKDLEESSLD